MLLPYISAVLRRPWSFRRAEDARAAPVLAHDFALGVDAVAPADEGITVSSESSRTPAVPRRLTWRRASLALVGLLCVAGAAAYTQKDRYTDNVADLSRRVIGDENTARVEGWYFRVQDRIDRTKYRVFGGDTNPFGSDRIVITILPRVQPEPIIYYAGKMPSAPDPRYVLIPDTIWPSPFVPPTVRQVSDHPADGEGVWTTAGLPRSTASDMLMAKTFVRPDPARPYAVVGVLLFDSRRVQLHVTGGTVDPGGDRGVKGTGLIPQDQYSKLLTAFNGGFKGPHGGFGMIADGKEYRPLRNGLASIALMKDGTLKMGEWGNDLTWSDDMEAVRQNAALLVKDGEITKRVNEGNDTWGYVKVDSTEFITWRSAVGLTKDGNLLVAAGNSLSAATLAKALWAAGAQAAMQLDINSPYVLTSTFFPQPDGSLRAERFMDSMPDSPGRFLKAQERDFFWVTLR
jgi:hypothetical protein